MSVYYADPAQRIPFGVSSPEQERQQDTIAAMLDFPIRSIFEAGCGAGRLANFFAHLPATAGATYSAIDVGPKQLAMTKAWRPDAELSISRLQDHRTRKRYDLVVSSQVLMHVPPRDLRTCIRRLLSLVGQGGRLILAEWVPLADETKQAFGNWPHDYEAILGDRIIRAQRTDRQMVYLVKP